LLVVLTGVSVLLAGCGCRPGTNNLGRGITTISFYVAEVQFLLIRALLKSIGNRSERKTVNFRKMGEFRYNRSRTDRPVSPKRKLGVLTLGGGACATNDAGRADPHMLVESMRPYSRQVPPCKESRVSYLGPATKCAARHSLRKIFSIRAGGLL
jgi:hypothetical protein